MRIGDPNGQPHPLIVRYLKYKRAQRTARMKRINELICKGLQFEKLKENEK